MDTKKWFPETRQVWTRLNAYGRFEQIIALALITLVGLVIVFALFNLVRDVVFQLVAHTLDPLNHETFQLIFGGIMTVLIAMEFNHTVQSIGNRGGTIIQTQTVLLIALLAIARKFIVMDTSAESAATIGALAVSVLALGFVYWLIKEHISDGKDSSDTFTD